MRYNKRTLKDIDVANKNVVVRVDFNVPLKDGKVADDTRIRAAIPTIKQLIDRGARPILLSHLSDIKTLEDLKGKKSLKPVAEDLQKKLGSKVKVIFSPHCRGKAVIDAANALKPGEILFLENTRYTDIDPQTGTVVKLESKNDSALGQFWASLGQAFVNDAFGTAHRAHASNVGIAQHQKNSCIGLLIEQELTQLAKGLDNPKRPFVAIVGGAKVSDKLGVIKTLLKDADKVLIGGGMAYTFFAAAGHKVGKSLLESDQIATAEATISGAKDKLLLPIDNLCATSFADVPATVIDGRDIPENMMALDIGPKTVSAYAQALKGAKTIAWNGPMGVAEFKHYEKGTLEICKTIAEQTARGAFSLIGGGDSAAAAAKLGFEDKFSHVSTGGGASLAYMEKAPLPGIEAIANK